MNSSSVDPVYAHSRREAIWILVIWGLSFAWTVPYCYYNGFRTTDPEWELEVVMGMPSWVFYGVAAPWFIAGVLSILMCLFYIQDDDLGHAEDEVPHGE